MAGGSIESTMSGGGGSEGDPLGGSPIDRCLYRQFVRDLAPGEAVPDHPAASSEYGYLVEGVPFRADRLHDGTGRDIDDDTRAATGRLVGADPAPRVLAAQWAIGEGGPPIVHSDAIDAPEPAGFVPGALEDDVYTYD